MPRPYVAYLRVYEPLAAFGDQPEERLLAAVQAGGLNKVSVGDRERGMWFASQFASPPRLLPAELADGRASPSGTTDVLVLQPDDVPKSKKVKVGPGPLVCPLELRPRSAAALVSFLTDAHPALRSMVLDAAGATMESVRTRTTAALRDVQSRALHVLSATWSVPLPWFTLVDPEQRRLVLGSGPADEKREMSWRIAMTDARRRVAEARELAESVIGTEGPTRVLIDTDRWLANFHPNSAVELDYGGLVQLIPDTQLESDTSAEEVHGVLEALRSGNVERLTDLFAELRDYWGELAAHERFN